MEKTEQNMHAYIEEVGASHSLEEHHWHYSRDENLVELPAIRVWRQFYYVLWDSHDSAYSHMVYFVRKKMSNVQKLQYASTIIYASEIWSYCKLTIVQNGDDKNHQ